MTALEMTSQRELAPMMTRVWSHLAPVIAKLIVVEPTLGHRLALASPRIVHAVAIYVDRAINAGTPATEVARNLSDEDVRDLLPSAIPDLHPRLFGLLGRAGNRVREASFYVRLNATLHGPALDFVLRADPVDTTVIGLAEQFGRDPVLLAAQHAIGRSMSRGLALASALALLRALGVANEIEALPPGSGWPAIRRRIEVDFGRVVVATAPFSIPGGWRQIGDVQTLQRIGRTMKNCVAHLSGGGLEHYRRMIASEILLLVSETDEPFLAEVERVAPRAWRLSNVLGKGNRVAWDEMSGDLTLALSGAMKVAGHTLLEGNPLHDLDVVLHRHPESAFGWERF